MKKEITDTCVTLIAQTADEAIQLNTTPLTTLREDYQVPNEKELAIDRTAVRRHLTTVTVQVPLRSGGYAIRDESK